MTEINKEKKSLTPEEQTEQMKRAVDVPEGLSRGGKRALRRYKGESPLITRISVLGQTEGIIETNDVVLCREELTENELVQEETKLALEGYRLFRAVGIPDSSIRSYFIRTLQGELLKGDMTNLWLQADWRQIQKNTEYRKIYDRKVEKMRKKMGNKVIVDEELGELALSLLQSNDIPINDIFQEILRSRAERIELIKLQTDWLLEHRSESEQPQISTEELISEEREVAPSVELASPESDLTAEDYSLSNWELFWTKKHWSTDQSHLITVPTGSREETLGFLSDLTREEISIKTLSLLRALEFHLGKSVIEKALATRNKYGPEGIRDWVKIKRGRDRIFLFVSEADSRVIFFAAGRDTVYRT